MTKTILKYALITTLLLTLSFSSFASHLVGIWTSYTQINGDTFRLELNLVRDCSGIPAPSSFTLTANACGTSISGSASLETVYQIPMGYLTSQSTCNGGTIPAYEVYTYADTLIFPSTCDSFTFVLGTCCYPASINYSSLSYTSTSERFVSQNSSAHFSPPYYYTFEGDTTKSFSIGLGVYDPDGDSLVYVLDNPPSGTGFMTPNPPYTSSNPYPWIVLDSITGQMEFTPPGVGTYLVYMKVYEYGADGTYKGTTDRGFIITFNFPTTNTQVLPVLDSVNNITGASYANNIFTTTSGATNICFDLVFSDTNVADTIYFTSNIAAALPGATVTLSGTNPLTAHVCWTYSLASGSHYHFKTSLRDVCSNCIGFSAVQEVEFLIKTWGTLPSVQDSAGICQGESYQINAGSADSIVWSVISGDPMNIGTNFSCDDCGNPLASPSVTTTYQIWGETQGFITIDTITISVETPMINSGLPSVTTICAGDTVWLNSNTGLGGVLWQDHSGDSLIEGLNIGCFDCDSNWLSPTDTTSVIFLSNPGGLCELVDTVTVNILHLPSSLLSANLETLCGDDSVNLSIPYLGSYQWNSINGSPVVSGNTIECDTCQSVWVSPDSNSTWAVTYSNIPGCEISDTISFVHNYITPSGLPSSISICQGDSFALNSNGTGYFTWSYLNSTAFIGVNISNTIGNPISIFPSSSDYLLAHNGVGAGCFQTDTINVLVQNLQADLGLPNAATICVGDSLIIASTGTANISWTSLMGASIIVGQNIDCDTCSTVNVSPNQSTIYQVTNTYFTGCLEIDTIAVSVNDSALIYGSALGQTSSSGPFALTNSLVTLFNYNGSNWVTEATILTDSNGYFYFYTNSDSVLVSCTPDSVQYGLQPELYFGNVFGQAQASILTTTVCGSDEASILYPIITGINNTKFADINVFPNPNTGVFTISANEIADYKIYSTTGALIQSGMLKTGNNSITLANAKGVYYVHISRNNKETIIQIIVE